MSRRWAVILLEADDAGVIDGGGVVGGTGEFVVESGFFGNGVLLRKQTLVCRNQSTLISC